MDAVTFEILINAKPKMAGPATPEPSLKHIVFGYYVDHVPEGMARKYTEDYFAVLKAHIGA